MDETTLTRTLRELAAEPVLHTAPSADARVRANRLQRRRRAGGTAAVAVVSVAVALLATTTGLGRHANGSPAAGDGPTALTRLITDPENPTRATTDYSLVANARDGSAVAVYWQGRHLCYQTWQGAGKSSRSGCSSVPPAPGAGLTVHDVGSESGYVLVSVSRGVTSVTVTRPDGSHVTETPVTAAGFPYRVVVTPGKVVALRGFDKDGHQLGGPVAGPDAAQLRPVLAAFACPATDQAGFDVVLPALDDATRCYGLAPVAMTLVPQAAQASEDPSQGWLVEVSLDSKARTAFGGLTGRLVGLPAPRNQLAVVLDGKVLEAPTIEQSITGGSLQISGGTKPFTQREAEQLAQMIGG